MAEERLYKQFYEYALRSRLCDIKTNNSVWVYYEI